MDTHLKDILYSTLSTKIIKGFEEISGCISSSLSKLDRSYALIMVLFKFLSSEDFTSASALLPFVNNPSEDFADIIKCMQENFSFKRDNVVLGLFSLAQLVVNGETYFRSPIVKALVYLDNKYMLHDCYQQFLLDWRRDNDLGVSKLEKAKIRMALGVTGNTPLHLAAAQVKGSFIKEFNKWYSNIDVCNSMGETPLFSAADAGDPAAIFLLIAEGADVHHKNYEWNTCLHIAAKRGYLTCLRVIIAASINVNEQGYLNNTALHFAVWEGHLPAVNLLIEKGANVNAKTSNLYTPLHYAAEQGNFLIIKALLAAGANIKAKTIGDWTPLDLAIVSNRSSCIKLLKLKGDFI